MCSRPNRCPTVFTRDTMRSLGDTCTRLHGDELRLRSRSYGGSVSRSILPGCNRPRPRLSVSGTFSLSRNPMRFRGRKGQEGAGGAGRAGEAGRAGKAGGVEERSTIVLVERLDVVEADDLVLVGILGSHFLWKMVRRIVGVLVEIGRGGLDASAAASFLRESSDAPARLTAPPSGLFLEHVWYATERRDEPLAPVTPLSAPRR